IYKICYRGTKPVKVDLEKCTDEELVQYQLHDNEWFARHARRILQERYGDVSRRDPTKEATRKLGQVRLSLANMIHHPDETRRLRALWTYRGIGTFESEPFHSILAEAMSDPADYVRGWSIGLALENSHAVESATFLARIRELARSDPSP